MQFTQITGKMYVHVLRERQNSRERERESKCGKMLTGKTK